MIVIVKPSYSHINRAIPEWDTPSGRKVKNEAHYKELCKQYNLIPYEEAQERASKNAKGKEYKLSSASKEIIKSAKNKSKNGKLNLNTGDALLTTMIGAGIVKKKGFGLEHLPAAYQPKGGFKS